MGLDVAFSMSNLHEMDTVLLGDLVDGLDATKRLEAELGLELGWMKPALFASVIGNPFLRTVSHLNTRPKLRVHFTLVRSLVLATPPIRASGSHCYLLYWLLAPARLSPF